MATDLLKVSANERIDLVDFDFLVDSGLQANLREPNAQFFTNPGGQRTWILDGFAMSNPAGKQLEVTKGRAILAQREGAVVYHGLLTTEGDASKILDLSLLTPSTSYGIYVRFEYVDGDTGSRTFWNPAGVGSELSQTVSTRRNANWSMRVELTNPGAEWTRIGTVDNTGGSLAITDERSFYFEGDVDASYASGWSSDGGGSATDRNADRSQYGVTDLQTFTEAVRQCLEDIKGRGLRRWWDRDIGGMNIGFDAAPVEDQLHVGDQYFGLNHSTTPQLMMDDNDYLLYNRASDYFEFGIAGGAEFRVGVSGVNITNGLYVGNATTTPTDNELRTEGAIHSGGRQVYFGIGSNDLIEYDDTGKDFSMWIDAAEEYTFGASAIDLHSNNIVNAADIDGSGDLTVGSITMTGNIYTLGNIGRDSTDYIYWDNNTNMQLYVNGVEEMRLNTFGLNVLNGLCVGNLTSNPGDNNIYVEGDVDCDGDVNAANVYVIEGDIFTTGRLGRDSTDYLYWLNNTRLQFYLNGTEEMRLNTHGLNVLNGLYVGNTTSDPGDNNIYAEGQIGAGGLIYGTIGQFNSNSTVTPGNANEATRRTGVNNVMACGGFDGSAGAGVTVFTPHFNIASVTYSSTGQFGVNLDIGVQRDSAVPFGGIKNGLSYGIFSTLQNGSAADATSWSVRLTNPVTAPPTYANVDFGFGIVGTPTGL